MKNHTKDFTNLIQKVLNENKKYFRELDNIKSEKQKNLTIKIFEDSKINLDDYKNDNGESSSNFLFIN